MESAEPGGGSGLHIVPVGFAAVLCAAGGAAAAGLTSSGNCRQNVDCSPGLEL